MRVLFGSPMATGSVALPQHGAAMDPAVVLGRHPGGLSRDAARPTCLSHGQEPVTTLAPMISPKAVAHRLACLERAVAAGPRHG